MIRTLKIICGIQISLILFVGCSIFNKSLKYQKSIIYEGRGINELNLDSLTIHDVFAKLGKQYEIIKWREYSYEYKYPKVGISFWYKQDDKEQKIISISVYTNRFKGSTFRGLNISKQTTLREIIKVYGNPEWGYAANTDVIDAEYEELGIYFSFRKLKEEDEISEDIENEIYLDKSPVEIAIGLVGTDY